MSKEMFGNAQVTLVLSEDKMDAIAFYLQWTRNVIGHDKHEEIDYLINAINEAMEKVQ